MTMSDLRRLTALVAIVEAANRAEVAYAKAHEADQALYDLMRTAASEGASLAQIAESAGCSKTWAKRCVDAKPGERP